jgi:DMSO/TMAO reductase YedYZ heme-binding membrane subunit
MRTYMNVIQFFKGFFLYGAILILLILPLVLVFSTKPLSQDVVLWLYDISHITIFFVMLVRPLADIFIRVKWIRPLVTLRKGVGVLSASIVVSFIFSKIIIDAEGYFGAMLTPAYWSLTHYALIAHLADISAILLLITSNKLSKTLLGVWWKRIQKLSYVFFYASSLYVFLSYGSISLLLSMGIITDVTILAYILNKRRAQNSQSLSAPNIQTV